MAGYRYRVETDQKTLYDGRDAADAMAAWSRAISSRAEYVMLESLRSPDEQTVNPDPYLGEEEPSRAERYGISEADLTESGI
ncbi:MAG TPA: hypothetical protein VGR71_16835 [Nitrospira sp.]|nr:hypothetical protein [Nitrospira sp.]